MAESMPSDGSSSSLKAGLPTASSLARALAYPYGLLLLTTLVFRIATALPLQQAGYMDASYSMLVAQNIATGRGLVEDVLWNYLDRPQGLPHPSNLYWMPLPAFMIAPFYALMGISYRAAQVPFILLSLVLPLFAFYLARRIYGRDSYAWAAAVFTAFSGFYTVYWVSPDNFTPFAVAGSVSLYAAARGVESGKARYLFGAGILAGFAHLARADGVLILAVIPLSLFLRPAYRSVKPILLLTAAALVGYLLVMGPWFVRDYVVAGSFYPSTGAKTLWLTNYDEVFRYADDLTLARYLAWGIGPILASKFTGAVQNLLIIAFGDLQLFLAPFAIAGLYQLRRRAELLPFFVYAALLYMAMAFAFTFPSWHGSMLHSAAALLPFFAVATPAGIDASMRWIARHRRRWNAEQAAAFYRIGFCFLAVIISLFLYAQGIFGPWVGEQGSIPLWNERDAEYTQVGSWLGQHAKASDIVMVVDPPSFFNVTHHPAIVIPTDSVEAVFEAARQYHAHYLVLQFDHPVPLSDLYRQRGEIPGLVARAQWQDALNRPVELYEIQE